MKIHFEGQFDQTPREQEKLAKVCISPSTNNRSCREIFILVAKEIATVKNGDDVAFGLVGKNNTPMIFPPKSTEDNRILLMGDVPQPGHRQGGYVDKEKTTAELLEVSSGGGAWGYGCVFLAILKDGDRVVSGELQMWKNVGGKLVKTQFDSLAEYELTETDNPQINLL